MIESSFINWLAKMKKPLIINDYEKITAVYQQSVKYLENHSDLLEKIATYLWAYNEIGTLVPQTLDNFWSGHFFPFSESYYELENSFELCKQGFYRHSFFALRCVLELSVLGLYFDQYNQSHLDIQEWLHSKKPTPSFKNMIKSIFKLQYFKQFNEAVPIHSEMEQTYNVLSDYTHVRGYRFSTTGQTISNFNQFNENSLKIYINLMKAVVKNNVIILLLKYPIGMQKLPLMEKFYLNTPMGGFLEQSGPQESVFAILDDNIKAILKDISDKDPTVQEIVTQINAMPDLTEEEIKQQNEKWDKHLEEHKPVNRDDKGDKKQ